MAWTWKREIFAWGIIVAVFVLVVLFGPSLPDQVPSHYDFHGNVDDTMQRSNFLLMIVGLTVGIYLGLTFLPFIDPIWSRIKSRYHVLMLLRDFTLAFMLVLLLLTLFASHEGRIPPAMLGIALGIMFALIGNYLPRLPRNWFFGIKTPWTLVSDIVWQKSHIVGGWMFLITGVLTVLTALLGMGWEYVLLPALIISTVVSGFIYPYLLNRRLQQEGAEDQTGQM
jgi:uncharacterized membrane protein